jgi:hypothetical protein
MYVLAIFILAAQYTLSSYVFSAVLSLLTEKRCVKENNWILYNNSEDGVSHTQQYCGIKRTHRFSVNNDNTALNT